MSHSSHLDELTDRARRIIANHQAKAAVTGTLASVVPSAGSLAADLSTRAPRATRATAALVPDRSRRHELARLSRPPVGSARVLGIDPGTATTGYGLVQTYEAASGDGATSEALDYGVIETPAGEPMPLRLLTLFRRLQGLIQHYAPTEVAVEQVFFGRNSTTAITVGQARGVVLVAAAEAGLPVSEYTPLQVKNATAGSGRADKAQMQRMVQTLLELDTVPQPDDAADALAVALCHVRLARMRALGLR